MFGQTMNLSQFLGRQMTGPRHDTLPDPREGERLQRMSRPPPAPSHIADPGMRVIWGIVAITCLPEIVLQLSDQGLLGQPLWRALAYQNGAFWPGLLGGWRPNYAAQPITMFLSYSWLHASLSHLLGNMLALLVLAHLLAPGTLGGGIRFGAVYLGSAFGAAVAFALLYPGPGWKASIRGAERTTKTSSGSMCPRRTAISLKEPFVAMETEAVAKVSLSQVNMIR